MINEIKKCLDHKGKIWFGFNTPEITGFHQECSLTTYIENEDDGTLDVWYDRDYSFTIDPALFTYDEVEDYWVGRTSMIKFLY